jgi:hypothetical protein
LAACPRSLRRLLPVPPATFSPSLAKTPVARALKLVSGSCLSLTRTVRTSFLFLRQRPYPGVRQRRPRDV